MVDKYKEDNKEDYAVVLDFLPNGYPMDNRPSYKKTPIAQTIGTNHFTILEVVPKEGKFLQPNQVVYIGNNEREEIHHIVGKLKYDKLTGTAQNTLSNVVKKTVEENQKKFIDFYNNARPLTTRMHQLELLPGLGKKHMWEIIEEREIEPFKDFKDLKERVKLMPDPEKAIIKRIMNELMGKEKHCIFVIQEQQQN